MPIWDLGPMIDGWLDPDIITKDYFTPPSDPITGVKDFGVLFGSATSRDLRSAGQSGGETAVDCGVVVGFYDPELAALLAGTG